MIGIVLHGMANWVNQQISSNIPNVADIP